MGAPVRDFDDWKAAFDGYERFRDELAAHAAPEVLTLVTDRVPPQ